MADPYSVLGVAKSADEKAIKSAFRKLAKKFHPDQNKGDKNAQTKFAEINQAYEILGDKDKRAQFDRGEIDEKGNPRFAGFNGGDGDPFAQFRQQGARPGGGFQSGFGDAEDILSELFGSAFGSASRGGFGRGPEFNAAHGTRQRQKPSLDVEATAVVSLEDMMRTKASLVLPNGKRVSVSIPPEAKDGQVIRLKGQGNAVPGRPAGDLRVTLKMKPHPKFRQEGADLRLDVPLDLQTATMGGKLPVETPDGKLSVAIPPGTGSGKVFRLKGKGLPRKGGGNGDLLVSTVVQVTEEQFGQLRELFNKS